MRRRRKKTLRDFRIEARKFWTFYVPNEIDFWPEDTYLGY